jgi:hypothetical protein
MEATKTTPGKTLYCSFCFKSQHDVTKLISRTAEPTTSSNA